jgi:Fe-S cluster biogenesis protein NfuA
VSTEEERDTQELAQRMQRIEALTQQLERCADQAARTASQELVAVLLEMHAAGLAKMLELLSAGGAEGVLSAFAADNLVASLLLLHGLHPDSLEVRVQRALERARPVLTSHQVEAEVLALDGGVVRLRLNGSDNTSPSRSAAVRLALEEAIFEFAPEILDVEIDGLPTVNTEDRRFALPLVSDK